MRRFIVGIVCGLLALAPWTSAVAVVPPSQPITDESINCELNKFSWGVYDGKNCKPEMKLFSDPALRGQIKNPCNAGFVLTPSKENGGKVFKPNEPKPKRGDFCNWALYDCCKP
jgi:hypothetical protein